MPIAGFQPQFDFNGNWTRSNNAVGGGNGCRLNLRVLLAGAALRRQYPHQCQCALFAALHGVLLSGSLARHFAPDARSRSTMGRRIACDRAIQPPHQRVRLESDQSHQPRRAGRLRRDPFESRQRQQHGSADAGAGCAGQPVQGARSDALRRSEWPDARLLAAGLA